MQWRNHGNAKLFSRHVGGGGGGVGKADDKISIVLIMRERAPQKPCYMFH